MRFMVATFLLVVFASCLPAEDFDYHVVDPDLKVVKLDSAETESFLGIQLDTEGRMFVGSRAALFVYEPQPDGTYAPRKELLRFPDHTWVYDIAIRGNDLYLLTVSALYVVPEGRIKRADLKIHRLVWGLPLGHVHQCFHGLAIGPEGDLYFASGDPLWYYGDFTRPDHWGHWTMFSKKPGAKFEDRDWVKTPYTGVGAVWKCRPDGSDLQVYARGLRNSCGLAFDHDWNLFTNDNDHESMPSEYVPGRLNHVTPHADFSWPRGWMKTKTPDRADLLDTMNPNLGRFVPVGQSYYDDPYLGEQYRHSLLVARWCTRKITYYPLKRKGATFECEEKELLVGRDQARPVHVTVGRGGRIFASICYMAQNEGSPVYKSDLVMITRKDDREGHPFEAYDATKVPEARLAKELADQAWTRRVAAHHEVIRRRPDQNLPDFALAIQEHRVHERKAHFPYIYVHAISRKPWVFDQALRGFGLHQARFAGFNFSSKGNPLPRLQDYLNESDPLVRLTALSNVHGPSGEADKLILKQATSHDPALRQTATTLLATRVALGDLKVAGASIDAKERLAMVLAAGFRLTRPASISALPKGAPLAAWRTEDAYKIHYADEPQPIDLRSFNLPIGLFTTAEHWKALKHTEEQEQLFALLMERLEDSDEQVKLQAAYFLSLLNDPRSEPKVVAVRTDIAKRRLGQAGPSAVAKAWVVGPFSDAGKGFDTVHPVESGSLDPSRTYEAGGKSLGWRDVGIMRQINFRELFGPCDDTSSYAYFRLESGTKQTAMLSVGSDDGVKVWQNGTPVFTNDVSRGALPLQDTVLVELQPGSNDFLVRVRNLTGESGLYLHYRARSPVAATLPEKLGASDLAERLKAAAADAGNTKVDPKFLEIDWTKAAEGGNAENGRKLYSANGLGCAKCHAATADATLNAGPSLADARKRFTPAYLVESVLLPSKQVSPVFKATLIQTKDGKTHTGLVVGETGEKLELILTDATKQTFAKSDIEDRKLQDLSPMPAGLVKTPEELRDILAYLLGEVVKAP